MSARRLMKIGLGAAAAVLLALGIAQLVLPRIAAKVLRDRVSKYGDVQSVSVTATPAIQLIWGEADSAEIDASQLRVAPKQLISLLLESKAVNGLTVRAGRVELIEPGFGAGPIALQDAVLRKEGSLMRASATLTQQALSSALPEGIKATVLAGGGGEVKVRASGQLFGFRAYIDALVHASEGRLLLTPTQPLLAGLGRVTLFADQGLEVLSVAARPAVRARGDATAGGAGSEAWVLSVEGRLR